MAQAGGHLKRFLSPSEYENGRVVGIWACVYLAMTVSVIVSAVPGDGNDPIMVGLAFVATLPLSLAVLVAQGGWMLAALAVCAVVNAFVFWVAFRGSARPRPQDRTVLVAAGRKGRLSKRATRHELGDSLHPRKKLGEGYGPYSN